METCILNKIYKLDTYDFPHGSIKYLSSIISYSVGFAVGCSKTWSSCCSWSSCSSCSSGTGISVARGGCGMRDPPWCVDDEGMCVVGGVWDLESVDDDGVFVGCWDDRGTCVGSGKIPDCMKGGGTCEGWGKLDPPVWWYDEVPDGLIKDGFPDGLINDGFPDGLIKDGFPSWAIG